MGVGVWSTLGRTLMGPGPQRREVHLLEPAPEDMSVSDQLPTDGHGRGEETRKLPGPLDVGSQSGSMQRQQFKG